MKQLNDSALQQVSGGAWGGGSSGGIPLLNSEKGNNCSDITITIGTGGISVEATLGQIWDCVSAPFSAIAEFIETERMIGNSNSWESWLHLQRLEAEMHNFGDPNLTGGWTVG
jgi:bacteriocin-like protein